MLNALPSNHCVDVPVGTRYLQQFTAKPIFSHFPHRIKYTFMPLIKARSYIYVLLSALVKLALLDLVTCHCQFVKHCHCQFVIVIVSSHYYEPDYSGTASIVRVHSTLQACVSANVNVG